MAKRAKQEKKPKKAAKKKGKAPSVMGFLSRVGGMPRIGDTPAKGLLGDISREDLVEAGRLGAGSGDPSPELFPAATVEADLAEPQGTYDHLEDVFADDDSAENRLNRARALGRTSRGDRSDRKSDRHSVKIRVEFRNAGRVEVDLAANISTGGAFVRTATPLEVGDPLLLTFEVPGVKFPLQLAARVKWVTPFGDVSSARPGMGVEFVALDERKRDILANLVSDVAEQEEATA